MRTPRFARARRLQFEALEKREVMAAGLTASLYSGVLFVDGDDSANTINIRQTGGWIAVDNIYMAWTAAQVNGIVVNLKGGNDQVNFFGQGDYVYVSSGAGTESVRTPDGHDVTFTGAGHIFELLANGTSKLDGAILDFNTPTPPPPPPVPPPPPPPSPSLPAPTTVGLTAQLGYGGLTINGTASGNLINLRQSGGWIAVDGVSMAWQSSQVNWIVINLLGGNDQVNLYGQGDIVTVYSGAANQKALLPDGHEVTFSAAGQVLQVLANGTATLNGQPLTWDNNPPPAGNWFDANIQDAALRTLGSLRYGDSLINRTDMIDLFRNAEDGGVVDATELADLRAIVNNTTLFGALDYVWKLSSYIVSANNAANANYLGQALGNLVAGSTGDHLEKLVGKWFLGLDHPVASGVYRNFAGQLFVGGAAYADIRQGAVGDCYFMATLAETALETPSAITNMFIVNGDGTYTVRFYNGGVAQYVTVDSYLPTNASGNLLYAGRGMNYNNSANELWTPLVEKAYVQINEFGWQRPGLPGSGQNAYSGIEGGYIYASIGHVTGRSTVAFASTAAGSSFSTFVAAYNANSIIGFASKPTPASTSVVGSHAYAVVGYNAAAQQVTLYNPWGPEYATITLSWAQVQANFSYFDRTA